MFAVRLIDDVELRPLNPWHAGEFLANLDRAREHIAPWVSPSFVATDLAGARRVLQRYADRWACDDGGIWGIWSGGTLVGGVLLVSLNAATGVCEAGCWLEPAAEGRGLVTRAVSRLVDWALVERGLHRVEWRTNAGNARSIAVARRLGMRRDGVLREVLPGPQGRIDLEVWSVLAPEWQARRSAADGRTSRGGAEAR
ncbi:GNAT family protein [Micromonospora sp. WMMD1082]|uniref:GNAT family N-acetyltransferase n=1 Tax=Micromonospora sp. WMMD1082 TaxID=3016104 RepID=UPI002416DA85|nr:GNAT family protein [Micromonospora sp. WMMD1082]MDG4796507.1 GNAT family protein [Micromonospora sp. WMMD1082]